MTPYRQKCPKCSKHISQCSKSSSTGQGMVTCDSCKNCFHSKCANVGKHRSDDSSFKCEYCLKYPCGKCHNPVFDYQNALCCEAKGCNKWYHLKCTKVSLHRYKIMQKNENCETWLCQKCYKFPFSHMGQSLFYLYYNSRY